MFIRMFSRGLSRGLGHRFRFCQIIPLAIKFLLIFNLFFYSYLPLLFASTDPGKEQKICLAEGGSWQEFNNACANFCGRSKKDFAVCSQVITMSCFCGKGSCWNSGKCIKISEYLKENSNSLKTNNYKNKEASEEVDDIDKTPEILDSATEMYEKKMKDLIKSAKDKAMSINQQNKNLISAKDKATLVNQENKALSGDNKNTSLNKDKKTPTASYGNNLKEIYQEAGISIELPKEIENPSDVDVNKNNETAKSNNGAGNGITGAKASEKEDESGFFSFLIPDEKEKKDLEKSLNIALPNKKDDPKNPNSKSKENIGEAKKTDKDISLDSFSIPN
jgi:hypothetical protein